MGPDQRAQLLRAMHVAAVAAADPLLVLPRHLPEPRRQGRVVVVSAGKAALAMARAVQMHWPHPIEGMVVVPRGTSGEVPGLSVLEASHPVPDDASLAAGRAVMRALVGLGPDDTVLALISGGGSSLLSQPALGVSPLEKQSITRALLLAGASIREINTVRKHLSSIKGGHLARAAAPARLVTLVLSDIPGDDPSLVASGPTLPDPSTCAQALSVLDHYRIGLSDGLRQLLREGRLETPKPGEAGFTVTDVRMIACAQVGLEAAAQVAQAHGVAPLILSDRMEGESRVVAGVHAAMALQVARREQPLAAPCVLLSRGETTVTVTGQGRGGRNTEFALAFALAAQGEPGISALSAGTDGIDGNCDAAGAIVDEHTVELARKRGLDALAYLHENDSYGLLSELGACLYTGPTGTNINDLRAVVIAP